ncbi:MAG: 1-acyl-sn-glycerol-3-phosphate acyltransferase [Bacteroidales bacterium]|jgi:1-acyl-sn-glycerol-3-phosphate acyltransferase|nr:1-acyl-sn-glycerol-3-phosphate acyltransferase [Bacteroidales bacterium]
MAISRETIEKKNIAYTILKPYVEGVTKLFFRTTSYNYKNVPTDEILIYAINHQNALMDALAVLATSNTQPVFLARADIFKKKTVAKILTFLKILPIYRIRDGKESLRNNNAVFQKTVDVLKNKNGLVILPEGTHGGLRTLKTLKKGISRIAFEAEESNDFKLNIKIIPVGLDWSNYQNFRSKLFVYYGEAINVSEYYEEYKNNPPRAMNMLRERLAVELKKYMIHIENDEYYDMVNHIRYIFLPQMISKLNFKDKKQPNQLYCEQKIIKNLNDFVHENPEEAKKLNETTLRYSELLKKLHLRNWVLQKGKFNILSLIGQILILFLFFPIYILGGIVYYLPYKTPVWATKKIQDPQFVSSVKVVIALLIFPVYYIIITVLSTFFIESFWCKLAIPTLLPFVGLFAFHYYIEAKKTFARIRFKLKTFFKNKDLIELIDLYKFIVQKMENIT